jgi:hypothetical protein
VLNCGRQRIRQHTLNKPFEAVMAQIQARNWNKSLRTLDHANGSSNRILSVRLRHRWELADLLRVTELRRLSHCGRRRPAHSARSHELVEAVGSLDEVAATCKWCGTAACGESCGRSPISRNVPLQVVPVNYLRWDVIAARSMIGNRQCGLSASPHHLR